MSKTNPFNIKYSPRIGAALGLFILIALNMILFLGRKKEALRSAFLENTFPDFYQHVSNFSISLMIYAMVGFIWLLIGVPSRYIAAMAIVMIFINAVYELWIPVLNTKDTTDAYYGITGVMTGFLFLTLVRNHGLKNFNN